jgi:hypothetical protein
MTKKIYHTHHIVPRHMGGSDDPSNLIKLTVEEHAEAHLKLYEEHGSKFDYIAYLALSNQIGYEEATYMKLLGPKNWSEEGLRRLSEAAKARTGEKNPFYGKTHNEESKQKNREAHTGSNNWITGVDPSLLPYTKKYEITYPNGETKQVAGLKSISEEFKVTIECVHATIKRIAKGSTPKRGAFANITIKEVK